MVTHNGGAVSSAQQKKLNYKGLWREERGNVKVQHQHKAKGQEGLITNSFCSDVFIFIWSRVCGHLTKSSIHSVSSGSGLCSLQRELSASLGAKWSILFTSQSLTLSVWVFRARNRTMRAVRGNLNCETEAGRINKELTLSVELGESSVASWVLWGSLFCSDDQWKLNHNQDYMISSMTCRESLDENGKVLFSSSLWKH